MHLSNSIPADFLRWLVQRFFWAECPARVCTKGSLPSRTSGAPRLGNGPTGQDGKERTPFCLFTCRARALCPRTPRGRDRETGKSSTRLAIKYLRPDEDDFAVEITRANRTEQPWGQTSVGSSALGVSERCTFFKSSFTVGAVPLAVLARQDSRGSRCGQQEWWKLAIVRVASHLNFMMFF